MQKIQKYQNEKHTIIMMYILKIMQDKYMMIVVRIIIISLKKTIKITANNILNHQKNNNDKIEQCIKIIT